MSGKEILGMEHAKPQTLTLSSANHPSSTSNVAAVAPGELVTRRQAQDQTSRARLVIPRRKNTLNTYARLRHELYHRQEG